MPDYIIIRISKQEQKDRKFKIGSLYIPEQLIYMTRNCQAGEVVEIGEAAKELLPGIEVGHVLIVHHFLESTSKSYFIDSDNIYNYYTCPCMETNMNLTYGYYNGETIIPHPDHVFLNAEKRAAKPMTPDEYIESAIAKTDGGLFVFKGWEETREDKEAKMERLKAENQELAKTGPDRPDVKKAIEEREAQLNKLSKEINSKKLLPYKVEFAHPVMSERFGKQITKGDILYCANFACQTKMEFQKVEYIVAKSEHVHFLVDDRFPMKINMNTDGRISKE